MKILHTSDWHLGIQLHKYDLYQEQKEVLNQIVKIVETENIDVVLISGDLYDTWQPSIKAMKLFDECMKTLCLKLKKKVILIAGNHDSNSKISMLQDLLEESGLYMVGNFNGSKAISIGNIDFYPIPYFHKKTIENYYQVECNTYQKAYQCILEDIKSKKTKNQQIILAHCFVQESITSNQFANHYFPNEAIAKELFLEFDYVALGHLHQMQKLSSNIYYSGSIFPYSFQGKNQKYVLIYDSEQKTVEKKALNISKKLHVIEGSFEYICKEVLHYKDCFLKLVLTDRIVTYELLRYFQSFPCDILAIQSTLTPTQDSITLDVQHFKTLSDLQIIENFFQDYYQKQLDQEELQWIEEMLQGDVE